MLSTRVFKLALADASDFRAARRIIVNSDVLRASKVAAGDVLCVISSQDTHNASFTIGIAWPSVDLSPDSIQVPLHHLLSLRLSEGDTVHLSPLPFNAKASQANRPYCISLQDILVAQTVCMREISTDSVVPRLSRSPTSSQDETKSKRRNWLSLLAREILVDLKYLTPNLVIELEYEGAPRRFSVTSTKKESDSTTALTTGFTQLSVGPASVSSAPTAWIATWDTAVHIEPLDESLPTTVPEPSISYTSIGGLDKQIAEIRDLIEIPLMRPDLFLVFGLKPPCGILLYGPPGTGKTHLARAVASSTQSATLVISGASLASAYHGETEAKLRDIFRRARLKSPCIIIIDEVDALCPKREEGAGGEVEKRVVATLLTEMDGVGENSGGKVVVVATTNRPNAIDPALRRPGRFDREIEIGIPDASARLSILRVMLSKTPHAITPDQLEQLASRTHGYVGADLGAIVRDAGTIAIKRHMASDAQGPLSTTLTMSDMLTSLASTRPSALREVFIETPRVRWTDIGGQESIKQKLRQSVEWPLLHPETFQRLGVSPPKGVLLYGPPGCSKTLTAKALATESGINFIAIKGPELLNKFVGESERSVREIFRKARASSPSIVFFDEIDALGTSRAGSDGVNSHEGVLTTLLNEMDGIQELAGVTIVAATNRPDVLDMALMRPGRLDRILYVGPPDQQGREEILRIRTSKMIVDPGLDLIEIASLTEGCSGAEIAALCQDAALMTMQRDMDAPYVAKADFVNAARSVRKHITRELVEYFERWRERSGLQSA